MFDSNDPFLTAVYDRLHDSPNQAKFRRLAPMPIGCVFLQSPDMDEAAMRGHFRLMRELGFTCLKQIMTCPGTSIAQVQHLALDEGIVPWWYDEGGWQEISDELLDHLGIARDLPIAQVRQHSAMRAHQEKVLRARIDGAEVPDPDAVAALRNTREIGGTRFSVLEGVLDEGLFSYDMELSPAAVPVFVQWLRLRYGCVEALCRAWNFDHVGIAPASEVAGEAAGGAWRSWDEVEAGVATFNKGEYRAWCDRLRFKADLLNAQTRRRVDEGLARDRHEPVRAGGEMGLFLPFAARATDMEGMAHEMARGGSFYPSIHLAWHFEESEFHAFRELYMQSSLAQDWFKGGWAATWESTGGPQQLSGGKGWRAWGKERTAGYTVDEGVISQLMFSYLAGGFKGVGLWCWNARTAGWEAGEYALLDRNNQVTPRARQAGRIGRAMRNWRDELWQARKEPLVGVYADFDNDAMWAAIAVSGRDKFKHTPVRARIGAARALIGANVPWEHVTASDLRDGLAGRYRVLLLPATIALPGDVLAILGDYVRAGGRVVVDAPSAWYDEFGRLLPTAPGTPWERTFGAAISDFQFSSNVPRQLDGLDLRGFVLDLSPTTARAVARFSSGAPAVTDNAVGQGHAVVLGYEASLMCFAPGDEAAEERLVRHTLGELASPYRCAQAVVYRLAAPGADHYFLLSDAPARVRARLETDFSYRAASDAVSGQSVPLRNDGTALDIEIEVHSGRWLRLEKTT